MMHHTNSSASTQMFHFSDDEQTRQFGQKLAHLLRPGMTFLLEGSVGAGKSHLTRSIIHALVGANIDVPSPTFTLVQSYDTPLGELWHADLYRLSDPGEIEELGLAEAMGQDLVFIEWPDRLGSYRPKEAITLRFTVLPEGRDLEVLNAPTDLLSALNEG